MSFGPQGILLFGTLGVFGCAAPPGYLAPRGYSATYQKHLEQFESATAMQADEGIVPQPIGRVSRSTSVIEPGDRAASGLTTRSAAAIPRID